MLLSALPQTALYRGLGLRSSTCTDEDQHEDGAGKCRYEGDITRSLVTRPTRATA
jgi:hypothetical protein